MPTASTSQVRLLPLPLRKLLRMQCLLKGEPGWAVLCYTQILGNNECFEPYTSNIYVRRVLSGEFTVVNQHLLSDLTTLGLWSADTKNELIAANGSVQVL